MDNWRGWIDEKIGREIEGLSGLVHDQRAFGESLSQILDLLDINAETEANADGENADDDEGSEDDSDQKSDADSESSSASDESESLESDADTIDGDGERGLEEMMDLADAEEDPDGDTRGNPIRPQFGDQKTQQYKAFSMVYDEVVDAETLCDMDELSRLRTQLDQQLVHLQGVVGRLANRLQRRLLAQQQRWWEFDLDGRNPGRWPARPRRHKSALSVILQSGETVRVSRYRRHAIAGQFRIHARPADLRRRHECRHNRAHP